MLQQLWRLHKQRYLSLAIVVAVMMEMIDLRIQQCSEMYASTDLNERMNVNDRMNEQI